MAGVHASWFGRGPCRNPDDVFAEEEVDTNEPPLKTTATVRADKDLSNKMAKLLKERTKVKKCLAKLLEERVKVKQW